MSKFIITFSCLAWSVLAIAQSNSEITVETIYSKHEVQVNYENIKSAVPEDWNSSDVGMKSKRIRSLSKRKEINKIIDEELSVYNDALKRHLFRIHVVKDLSFFNEVYQGAVFDSDIIISVNGALDADQLRKTIHHEFSSILLYISDFPEEEWKSLNKVKYLGASEDAIQSGETSLELDKNLMTKGVLCEYAKAALEEDFNMFSEYLLTSREIQNMINSDDNGREKYKRILKKTEIWFNHYKALDPNFKLPRVSN